MTKRVDLYVDAVFDPYADKLHRIIPFGLRLEPSGHYFEIDDVLEIVKRPALKVGAIGVRFKIRVGRQIRYIFLEEDKWFAEGKDDVRTV